MKMKNIKTFLEIETSLLKDRVYVGIIKVNLLEIGHEQHELFISLKSDLKSLESVQEVLDDDGGNVFQGALALVEMML